MADLRAGTVDLSYFADALRDALGLERLYTANPLDPKRVTTEEREMIRFDGFGRARYGASITRELRSPRDFGTAG